MTVHRILCPALAVGIAVCFTAAASTAGAFCRTTTCAVSNPPPECFRDADGCFAAGIPLFWEQQCVSIAVAGSGSPKLGLDHGAAENATVTAFSLWLNNMCADGFPSIAVMNRGALACNAVEYNPTGPNANAVLFRDEGWSHDPSALALTTVAFSPRTGKILDVDMEINSSMSAFTSLSLEWVIGHEAGHFLGLDHSPDPTALMYYRHTLGDTTPPSLQPDDQAAICAAYPPSRSVPVCDFEPPKGFAPDCGGDVESGCGVGRGRPSTGGAAMVSVASLLAAVTAVAWWARRRRRRAGGLSAPPFKIPS